MRSPLSIIKSILSKLHLLTAVILLIIACLISFARVYTPILKNYQPDIAKWAAQYLNHPVNIGEMHAYWHHFEPMINFSNVSMLNTKQSKTLLHINQLHVGIAVFKSLMQRQLVIDQLYVNGVALTLEQQKNGQWMLKGLKNNTDDEQATETIVNQLTAWLMEQPQIVLENINIKIKPKNYPQHTLTDINIILKNSGKQHQLRGTAKIDDSLKSNLHIALDLSGSEDDLHQTQGQWYIAVSQISLNDILKKIAWLNLSFSDGIFNAQIWGSWNKNEIDDVQSQLTLQKTILQGELDSQTSIDNLEANLQWKKIESTGWELSGDHINLILNNHPWALSQFSLWTSLLPNQQHQTIVQVKNIELADLYPLLVGSTILPDSVRDKWKKLNPIGAISDFKFMHQTDQQQKDQFNVQFKFTNLGIKAYQKIPVFSGLSGDFAMDNDTGIAHLDTEDGQVELGNIFSKPFELKNCTGTVQWQRRFDALEVQGLNLALSDANLQFDTGFDLLLPDNGAGPYLRLLGHLHEDDLSKFTTYLPTKIMDANLADWLNKAFVSGKSVDANFLLNGNVQDYPFADKSGQYLVDAQVDNLQFHFADGWQDLQAFTGNLIFRQADLLFNMSSGKIAGQPISALKANIANMSGKSPMLEIKTQVDIDNLSSIRSFLIESPLKNDLSALQNIQLMGKANLQLELGIPLAEGQNKTDGTILLNQAAVQLTNYNLNFTQVTGPLQFTNEKLSSKGLVAQLMGHPVNLSIRTFYSHKKPIKEFTMTGQITASNIADYFSFPDTSFITGLTSYQAKLRLSDTGGDLNVSSDLSGIQMKLPQNYAKSSEQKLPTIVNVNFVNGKSTHIDINYAGGVNALVSYQSHDNKMAFDRGIIQLGSSKYTLPKTPVMLIKGVFESFTWDQWQPIFDAYKKSKTAVISTDSSQIPLAFDLYFSNFFGKNQHLKNAHIKANEIKDVWDINITSNQIEGVLHIPEDYRQKTTVARLKKLILTSGFNDNSKNVDFKSSDLIPLDIAIGHFKFGDHDLSSVALKVSLDKNGANIERFAVKSPFYQLESIGQWQANNKIEATLLKGQLTITDFGNMLKEEGITDHLRKGKGTIKFNLQWPQTPLDFSIKKVEGTVAVDLNNGSIVGLDKATSQKIGLGKLINAFSVESLAKRLSFNFGDLNDSTFDFDTMQSDIVIKPSILSTDDFFIDSSVAKIHAAGNLNVVKETYDLNLKITPYLTSSLPLIATIAGGPIIGAATWAASKVVQFGVDNVVIYHYHIGGTWDNPVVTSGESAPAAVPVVKTTIVKDATTEEPTTATSSTTKLPLPAPSRS